MSSTSNGDSVNQLFVTLFIWYAYATQFSMHYRSIMSITEVVLSSCRDANDDDDVDA